MHTSFCGKAEPKSIISPFFVLIYSLEYVLLPKYISKMENLKG